MPIHQFVDIPNPFSWDALYTTELSNHAADPSDVGTIWFDDSSAEDKVLSYLHSAELDLDLEKTSFLDIGTGNGHFLFRLRENPDSEAGDEDEDEGHEGGDAEARDRRKQQHNGGFKGRILGTDYSQNSITFALQLAASKSLSSLHSHPLGIEFLYFDILTSPSSLVLTPPNEKGWDVVLDKGTFDAISLSSERDASGRRIVEGYREHVVPLIRDGGYFLVTSCNWTEEELRGWFEGPYVYGGGEGQGGREDEILEYVGRVAYPSFSFGGRKGQTISSTCFRKAKT